MVQDEFGDKLKKLRTQYGMTQKELGKKLGVGKSAICNYESGYSMPDTEKIIAISELFHVSVDYLLGVDTASPKDTYYSGSLKQDSAGYQTIARVPVLDEILGELPKYPAQKAVDYIVIPASPDNAKEYFGLRVNDNSMNQARIAKGDTILVRKQQKVESGDIVVALAGSKRAVIRKVLIEGSTITLIPQSDDSTYQPQVFDLDQDPVKILGKVINVIVFI